MNVHFVRNMSAFYDVEKKVILAPPGLTRAEIEETARAAYTLEKKAV